ncbi:ribonuclease P protein subunit p25-like protein [Drosophila grimshawi]|uniref:GH21749 n=1 Tax=Drosophila grimshawi TaxID=7222 RepID=B4J6J3_DROGR|nr:ribonuclease P protein subunit p25-like protein [Drosophila grimshawi]XP_032591382.1 ribonuclease P protein subunit p25-like protein [Drosophila grimshawi]EDW01994.1 GH21749 [Drosophila grimshawi]
MMHYRKAENVEQELSKTDLPFENCMPKTHKDFLWMHVKGGTKVSNVIEFAQAALDKGEYRSLVWSGSGGGVVKTISCAEVLKRSHPLYQVTRMGYTSVEEHWKPQMDGLEEIIVTRQIPTLHILMSLDELSDSIEGLQKPNTNSDFWQYDEASPASASSAKRTNKRPRFARNKQQQQQQQQQQQTTQGKPVGDNAISGQG